MIAEVELASIAESERGKGKVEVEVMVADSVGASRRKPGPA